MTEVPNQYKWPIKAIAWPIQATLPWPRSDSTHGHSPGASGVRRAGCKGKRILLCFSAVCMAAFHRLGSGWSPGKAESASSYWLTINRCSCL